MNIWKIVICLTILTVSLAGLSAQIYVPEDEDIVYEDYAYRGERKSAATAIVLSSIFPGSGHFYVNKRTVGTYIFPVVEIALWAGYIHFNSKGQDIERDYMAYADEHYDRVRQTTAQNNLINNPQASDTIYSDVHFRLDSTNTQHYYEDIGKYNKYVFGWEDWYTIYFQDGVQWLLDGQGLWLGNYPTTTDADLLAQEGLDPDQAYAPYSSLRAEYIKMRRDAQESFDRRTLMTFGLVFNRIISSLDVVRVTTKYNRELRYSSSFDFGLQPTFVNNQFTPMFNASYKF